MPHSVTPEPIEDVIMEDASHENPEQSSPDSEGQAPAVEDAVNDGSDKENRKALEDMFNDDSDDDEFSSSAPQRTAGTDSQEQTYAVYSTIYELSIDNGAEKPHRLQSTPTQA